MELHFEELLGKITDFIKSEAKTETVVGSQFELGEFKCVPVIKVGMGFGSGGGEGIEPKGRKGEGVGAGAGVGIEPMNIKAFDPLNAQLVLEYWWPFFFPLFRVFMSSSWGSHHLYQQTNNHTDK